MAKAHKSAASHVQLERLPSANPQAAGLGEALQESIANGDTGPLRTWAHERGAAAARSGAGKQALVDEILLLARALDGRLPTAAGSDVSPGVESAMVVAAIEGYSEGGSSAPIELLRDRVAELTALHRVISAANSSLKLSDMLTETAQAVVAVTRADVCSIFLYEPERDQLVRTATSGPDPGGEGPARQQLGEGITGWAAMAGVPVAVRNVQADPRFQRFSSTREDKAVSILVVPVVLFTNEQLVGVISLRTFEERDFSDTEIKFLETVAGEIAIAIENARLYEQTDARLRQKVAELTTLQGVSAHMTSTLNLSEVLALIAHQAAHLVHADAAAIYALNPEAAVLEQVAHYNLRDPHHSIYEANVGPRLTLDLERSAIARAVTRGIPVPLPPDADADLGLELASQGYQSMYCVPLVAPRGIMGGICLYDQENRSFSEEQVHLLDAFAHEAAIALENSRLYEAALRGLQIKSAMLQEMNHRVRNNLQTVAGLLSMQMRRMPANSEAATAVRESISRIQSMAAAHDLMTGRDAESTSLYELAHQVAEAVVSILSKPGFKLDLIIEPDPAEHIKVRSHEATLLALLLNELISNAILHGFSGLESGELRIRAWAGGAGGRKGKDGNKRADGANSAYPTVHIEVADNGTGLPEGFDPQRDANLGLNIVRTMVVGDLRGEFHIRPAARGTGTVAHIAFKRPYVSEPDAPAPS
jgi:two-component sensor histidine kinase/putative methionine-R-sulfoxide reductase with GAF domain